MVEGYDVLVIGGGPAGLTAACFSARQGLRTALFEQQPERGVLAHPCGGIITPIREFVTLVPQRNGVYFKEVDFLFSNQMIIAYPKQKRFFSPDGCNFGMRISKSMEQFPVFQVDKKQLLRTLADKAEGEGAELAYGCRATRLIQEDGFVKGAIINGRPIKSNVVIAAEGFSRKLTAEAGLHSSKASNHICILTEYLSNLSHQEADQGCTVTFRNDSKVLSETSLTLYTIGKDRAMVVFSTSLPQHHWPHSKPIAYYFKERVSKTPWLKKVYAEEVVTGRKMCWLALQKPTTLVANGFLGAGDSVAPVGYTSNAIAMIMGSEAAKTASTALKKSDVSSVSLSKYDRLNGSKLFETVEFESNFIAKLHELTDQELNKVCKILSKVNLEAFFLGTARQQRAATIKLLLNPRITKNWSLIRHLLQQKN